MLLGGPPFCRFFLKKNIAKSDRRLESSHAGYGNAARTKRRITRQRRGRKGTAPQDRAAEAASRQALWGRSRRRWTETRRRPPPPYPEPLPEGNPLAWGTFPKPPRTPHQQTLWRSRRRWQRRPTAQQESRRSRLNPPQGQRHQCKRHLASMPQASAGGREALGIVATVVAPICLWEAPCSKKAGLPYKRALAKPKV